MINQSLIYDYDIYSTVLSGYWDNVFIDSDDIIEFHSAYLFKYKDRHYLYSIFHDSFIEQTNIKERDLIEKLWYCYGWHEGVKGFRML